MATLRIILIAVGGVVVLAVAAWFFFLRDPDLSSYLPLKEPRMVRRPSERVLEVRFSGPADIVIKGAYDLLFKTYFGLKGSPKGPGMKPPKARYYIPADLDVSAEKRMSYIMSRNWTGAVAIPVPDSLVLSAQKPGTGTMEPRIATWEYSDVAEILHLGPYDTEPATIQKLEDFIKAGGYKVIGDHEEEYLKGPGRPLVAPKDYWTIIRYRVTASAP